MEESRIRVLMAKKISNTADASELAELDALLSSFPAYRLLYKVMSQMQTNIRETPDEKEIEIQLGHLWNKIKQQKAEEAVPVLKVVTATNYTQWIAAAAVIIAVLTAGIFASHKNSPVQQLAASYRTITVPYGKTSSVILSDGTVVKLNSGTTLSFPLAFAKNSREVKLVGEAFFEVTKNPKRPFLVHAGHLTVRVLGTAFNVKAYEEDKNVETTLIHGKVQVVMDNQPDKKIILLPNQKLTIDKEPALVHQQHANDQIAELKYKLQAVAPMPHVGIDEIAWITHKVAFSDQSFGEVAKVIERKYNVVVEFKQEKLKDELITGVFEGEKLPEALRLLQMTTDFDYTIIGDKVTLTTK